jgi:hypothetical protein
MRSGLRDSSPHSTVIERGNATRKRVDEAVQLGIGQCSVHVSVPLRGVAVEIVRAENNFERMREKNFCTTFVPKHCF